MMMTRTPPRWGENDDEHGGYPLGNPFRRRHDADDPLGASTETPVDLAAVQGDDVLLDMLGGAEVARGLADAELARVLVAWRREVDAEPIGERPDTDKALTAIKTGRRRRRRGPGCLHTLTLAAAVLVIAFAVLGLAAASAVPGDDARARRALDRAYEQLPALAEGVGRASAEHLYEQLVVELGDRGRLPPGIEQAFGDSLPHIAPIQHTALSERRAAIRATAQSCARHGLDAAALAELLDVLGLDPAEARVARC